MLTIEKRFFGQAINPLTTKSVDVHRYIMSNNNNMTISLLTIGARIQSIKYPDKHGNIKDVCLGFEDVQGYMDNKTTYMGATVGRVASRVAEGKFTMGCKEYKVTKNLKDKHQINGGFNSFDCMIWEVIEIKPNGIVMRHVNPHGFEGYPGKLTINITFTLDDDNNFRVCIEAKAKKITPVNITNYVYFNLAGHDARKEGLFLHNIMLKSKKIIDCNNEQIPNGCLKPVTHTLFDLRKYVNLGKRIKKFFNHSIKGFDNHYCIESYENQIKPISKVIDPCSGRWLEVSSNQPAVHFLTCNDWPDLDKPGVEPIIGKGKAVYAQYGAFCLATQNYPDAMNHSNFPCVFLNPRQRYYHDVIYRFGCCN